MSQESDAYNATVAQLKGQKDQVVTYVAKVQTDLVAANAKIAELLASGAPDAELAAAVRAAQPEIVQVVNDLDLITPEGTPVITPSARRR